MQPIITFIQTFLVEIILVIIGGFYVYCQHKRILFESKKPYVFLNHPPAIPTAPNSQLAWLTLSWFIVVAIGNIIPRAFPWGDSIHWHIAFNSHYFINIPLFRLLILLDLLFIWLWRKKLGISWKLLGFRRLPVWLVIIWTALSGIDQLLSYGVASAQHRIDYPAFWHQLTTIPLGGWLVIIMAIFIGLLPDMVVEEVVCRGIFFQVFRSRWGAFPAWILQAVIFGLSHFMVQANVAGAITPGLLFGLGVLGTGSLVPGLISHTLFDMKAFLAKSVH